MKGKHLVLVQNRRLQYKFSVERNITILRGDSATGKTTLIEMLAAWEENGSASGINVSCDKNCTVLTGKRWQENLSAISDSIVFIDEGNAFITSRTFAAAVKNSDNYYVLATRELLPMLPYSIQEIYGIRNTTSKKYQGTKRLYSTFYPLCKTDLDLMAKPDLVMAEDQNAGFEFYQHLCSQYQIPCVSANGKSNLYHRLAQLEPDKIVLVIADGAALGPEIESLLALKKIRNLILYFPESFEWVILKSGLVADCEKILAAPYAFIESKDYFSWERFFTDLLVERSRGTFLSYSKSNLNLNYLRERETESIRKVLPEMTWENQNAAGILSHQ